MLFSYYFFTCCHELVLKEMLIFGFKMGKNEKGSVLVLKGGQSAWVSLIEMHVRVEGSFT